MSSVLSIKHPLVEPEYDNEAKVNVKRIWDEILHSDFASLYNSELENQIQVDNDRITEDPTFARLIKSFVGHSYRCIELAKNFDYKMRTKPY